MKARLTMRATKQADQTDAEALVTPATPEAPAESDAASLASPATIDGAGLVLALKAGMGWLERNLAAVNALNVFPVPDGDTGTNMFLTMKAAYEAALEGGSAPGRAIGEVASRTAYGALMGARGNSGVILSQIFRGIAKALEGHAMLDGKLLAAAFTEASAMAYKAVLKPVEGTLLTVARGTAEAATTAIKASSDVRAVLDAALTGARATLARTPEMLPLLREAGVVDAGGQGFVMILEGMRLHLAGRNIETEDLPEITPAAHGAMAFDMGEITAQHGEDDFGYCTNFLLTAAPGVTLDFTALREHFAGMGHSAVIVGDEQYLKAHIHTVDPGACLSYAVQFGSLTQVKIDNMDAQVETLEGHAPPAPSLLTEVAGVAVIAVAAGAGLSAVLSGQGARVVRGGQTMNPSTQEILDAINAAPAESVIVLPNNGNIILAARQAVEMTHKQVRVLPSKSVPQGIAALAQFTFDADLDANVAAMTEAMSAVRTGEVTRAVRTATIGGITVESGQAIGLIDDVLTVAGADVPAVTLDLLAKMDAGTAELITLYRGADASEADADALKTRIETTYPDAAVELLPGGQPHYDYVLSVE